MEPYIIAASILSADFTRLGEQIAEVETAGADWVHVDVMDWHFVPNLTMGPFIVEACRRATNMPLNVHLMVDQPETMLEAFARAGASHMIVHVETCPQIERTLKLIKSLGCQAGVTLNPATSTSTLEPAYSLADLVLVMTVHPGFAGQSFRTDVVPKIREARSYIDRERLAIGLQVDGGIKVDTAAVVAEAGADILVSGSGIFPDHVRENLRKIREVAQAASRRNP